MIQYIFLFVKRFLKKDKTEYKTPEFKKDVAKYKPYLTTSFYFNSILILYLFYIYSMIRSESGVTSQAFTTTCTPAHFAFRSASPNLGSVRSFGSNDRN